MPRRGAPPNKRIRTRNQSRLEQDSSSQAGSTADSNTGVDQSEFEQDDLDSLRRLPAGFSREVPSTDEEVSQLAHHLTTMASDGPPNSPPNDDDNVTPEEPMNAEETDVRPRERTLVRSSATRRSGQAETDNIIIALTDNLTNAAYRRIAGIDKDFIYNIQYIGFDPDACLGKIINRLMILRNKQVSQVKTDVMRLCAVHLQRGNNTITMVKTMEASLGAYFSTLFNAIPVLPKLNKAEVRDCVTLARISHCFPEMTFELASEFGAQNVTGMALFESPEFPAPLRAGSFAALCRADETGGVREVLLSNLLKAHTLYQAYASKVYKNQELKVKTEDLKTQFVYSKAAVASSIVKTIRINQTIFDPLSGILDIKGGELVYAQPNIQLAIDKFNSLMNEL